MTVRKLFWQINVTILMTQRAWISPQVLGMCVAISGPENLALGRAVVDLGSAIRLSSGGTVHHE